MRRFVALAAALLMAAACSGRTEPPADAPAAAPAHEEGSGEGSSDLPPPPDGSASGSGEGAAAPLPPELRIEQASTAFALGRDGGTLLAGAMRLEVPAGALPEQTTVSLEVVPDPAALGRRLPDSLILGSYRGEPWNPWFSRAVRVTVPLNRELPPGTPLELLAWQPQMRAFIVAGVSQADETGRSATFAVRQLGDMVVRGVPVRDPLADEACPGDSFAIHEAWPAPSEDETVGLTAIEERFPRGVAFSLLSDFRLAPTFDLVDFKNEEVTDGPFRADERDHRDEDYLMDPNAAAALSALASLVAAEWKDPFTGAPAVRVRVTEAYDSLIEHSPQSTHYQGRAIDLTTSPVPAAEGSSRRQWYGRLSRLAVCAGFDWVLFENAAHVHASVVPTEIALVSDAGDALEVSTGTLRWPRRMRQTSHRWAVEPDGVAAVRWSGADRFELVTHPPEQAAPAPEVVDASYRTVDGLRQIVIVNGRAYLTNVGPLPPLGSFDADGTPVDVEYPLPLSPADRFVVSASFREHRPTREAFERHVLGGGR